MQLISTCLEMNDIFGCGELSTTVALTSKEIAKIKSDIKRDPKRYMSVEEECYFLFKNLSEFSGCACMPGPKKVIFNGPATIVIWNDNTKTIVKRREGEPDDKDKAVMYCILKKLCGNKAAMDKYLKLFLKEELNDEEKA